MQKITIRLATSDDLYEIHNLVRELAIYERAEKEFVATLEEYHQDFNEGVFEAIVAEDSEGVLGMALYYLTYSTWKGKMLYLEDFVIKKAYRRMGIGNLLFEKVVAVAKDKGCKILKWQVLDWNEPALRFYERKGALIEKDWWNGKIIF